MADEDLKVEKYQDFLDFDWNHEGWLKYLDGLYPPPQGKQLNKFMKKWYKKNVDKDFDETYEPYVDEPEEAHESPGGGRGDAARGSGSSSHGASSSSSAPPPMPNGAFADGTRWQVMRQKATICLCAYGASLVMGIGTYVQAFPAYQSLLVLVMAFVLELLAKYGLKFTADYLHHILLDDVGVLPIMAITLLMPGLHPSLRTFCITPFFLSAVLSFAQICKNHPTLPAWFSDFFAPLANSVARYRIMEFRGHCEVAVGVALLVGIFAGLAAPFSALLFWNFMMMRYMMSIWVQNTFRKIDGTLSPTLGKIPGVKLGYAALKNWLYGFVDPSSKRAGKLCTIL